MVAFLQQVLGVRKHNHSITTVFPSRYKGDYNNLISRVTRKKVLKIVMGKAVCSSDPSWFEASFQVLSLHFRGGKVWLGHLVSTLHHLVEPGVHSHAGVGALT